MTELVITWNTHKVETGYEFHVYSFGYQVPAVTLKKGICRSRAIAKSQAQKWVRYLNAKAAVTTWVPMTAAQAADAHRRDSSGFINPAHD